MALRILLIVFAVMSVISILGLLLLILVKSEKKKAAICYFLAVWGMLIAWMSADSLPSNYIGSQVIVWAFGILGVVGLLLQLCGKNRKAVLAARILVSLSVILGLLMMFLG